MKLRLERFRPTVPSLIGSLVLIAAAAFILSSTMGAGANTAQDEAQIKNTVLAAFQLIHGGATKVPDQFLERASGSVPQEVLDGMRQRAVADLESVYAADSILLQTRTEQMLAEIDRQGRDGYFDLGGGAHSVKDLTIQVNGDTAVAEADLTYWSSYKENGVVYKPENAAHWRWNLVREDGDWRITDETWTYLPGQEP